MNVLPPLLSRLMESLRCLPGVGPKSAQRMALHLLERDPEGARHLARTLNEAMDGIRRCARCRTFSQQELCPLCADPGRDASLLCVVESPADVLALEHTGVYRGRYFVLLGRLSPLDGLGPRELGMEQLEEVLTGGAISELILATNPTVEGEATAHYLAQMAALHGVPASRIAHGVPMGGELEYIDGGTLAHAFAGRRDVAEPT